MEVLSFLLFQVQHFLYSQTQPWMKSLWTKTDCTRCSSTQCIISNYVQLYTSNKTQLTFSTFSPDRVYCFDEGHWQETDANGGFQGHQKLVSNNSQSRHKNMTSKILSQNLIIQITSKDPSSSCATSTSACQTLLQLRTKTEVPETFTFPLFLNHFHFLQIILSSPSWSTTTNQRMWMRGRPIARESFLSAPPTGYSLL